MWNPIKKRAIKQYYKVLPEALAKDYGRCECYTSAQVKAALKNHRLSRAYAQYAVALFTSFEETGDVFKSEYPKANGYQVRAQVADLLFAGNMHYVMSKQLRLSGYGNDGGDPMAGGTQTGES